MWIIALLVCSMTALESSAQELNLDFQAVTEEPEINQDVIWDHESPRSPVTLNIQHGHSSADHKPQNEISEQPLMYSNQWRPFLMPLPFSPYIDRNYNDAQRNNLSAQQFLPTLLHRPNSPELNVSYPNLVGAENYQSEIENAKALSQHSRTAQSSFSAVPIAIRPPIMYPNTLSFNMRRSYTTKYGEGPNSSDSIPRDSVPEPVASTFEEKYSQVLPSPAFPSIPLSPQHTFPSFPYGNYGNPIGFYPQAAPFVFPFNPTPLPLPNDSIFPVNSENANIPQYDRELGSEYEESTPSVPEHPVFQQPRALNDQSTEDTQRSIPKFVPRSSYPLPFGGQSFGPWPAAMFPPVLRNPATSRILPLHPHLPPQAPIIPQEEPVVSEPIYVDNRLPLPTIPEVLPATAESSLTKDLQDETVIPEEKPNTLRIPYEFGYDMNDGHGTDQHRKEVSDGAGVVRGSYGYRDVFGVYRLVNYIADKNGFRAFVKSNEPGVSSSGSADVIVVADRPPSDVIEESLKASSPEAVIVRDEVVPDLIAEGSETLAD